MALPTSGTITAAMINVELKRASTAAFNLNDAGVRALAGKTSGAISFSDFYGKSSEIVATATVATRKISSYFSAANWSSNFDKRFIVPAGVHPSYYLSTSDTAAWGGHLTVVINGDCRGYAGTANSGAGGYGFYTNMGTTANLSLINNGAIRGGGGGGGRGGNGGNGYWDQAITVREPASGDTFTTTTNWGVSTEYWESGQSTNWGVLWNGQQVAGGSQGGPASVAVGSITYYKGTLRSGNGNPNGGWGVYRTYPSSTRHYTTGGAGGNGGIGVGYNQANAAGAAGANGGTNAGKGGTGGTGGTWGSAGGTGATGAAGNNGAGAGGAAGGGAGPSIQGRNRMNYSGAGTLNGGTANT